jgi:hypothetical protein
MADVLHGQSEGVQLAQLKKKINNWLYQLLVSNFTAMNNKGKDTPLYVLSCEFSPERKNSKTEGRRKYTYCGYIS